MVRLKPGQRHFDKIASPKFQFHNGSIKTSDLLIRKAALAHFNSTMVRLKHNNKYEKQNYLSVFQFHNGSIKTLNYLR